MFLIDRDIIKNCGTIVTVCHIMDFSSPSYSADTIKSRIICKNITTTRILFLQFFLIRKFVFKITNKIIIFATTFDYYPIRGGCVCVCVLSLCKGSMVDRVSKTVGNGSRIAE